MKNVSITIFALITVIAVVGYASKIDHGDNTSLGVQSVYSNASQGSAIEIQAMQSKEPISRVLVVLISGFLIISLLAGIRRNNKRQVIKKSKPNLQQHTSQIKHPS